MTTSVSRPVRWPTVFVLTALALVCGLLAFGSGASAAPVAPGNNGTLKIHEKGTPDGTPNNDPKVCVFNVEAFGLDAGQTGYLTFSVQGGDAPTGTPAGPFDFGPANGDGFYASQYFNLDPGHYKATLYGKQLPNGSLTDVKAKSKVFKVTCAEPSPSPSVLPSKSTRPSESPEPSPSVLPSTKTRPSKSASPKPRVLSGNQVNQVPAGAVSAGGGSTSGADSGLLALGSTLLFAALLVAIVRRRVPLN